MVLLPLLFAFVISEPLWKWWKHNHWRPDVRDAALLDSLAAAWGQDTSSGYVAAGSLSIDSFPVHVEAGRYFKFDPNSSSTGELLQLGFNTRLAERIRNYRKKGGRFRKKEDLLRVYGMDTAHYRRLIPYIVISSTVAANAPGFRSKVHTETGKRGAFFSKAHHNDAPFDVNNADTARLEAIRGIGQKLSRRIIKYRSSLGGFVSVGQLEEVFGLDSVVLQQLLKTAFVDPDFLPHRINLNTADEKLLDSHPYISRQEARAIVAYRFQHGRFGSVSELRNLPMFSEEKVRRLEPYLRTVE